ncbi:guanine deaminase-like [Physella acuta]|uniref:guanine deaminase-like n=1 Tax=Physella acuta TaxID=109671 RepID=UPI0027DC9AEE|nr:guanine deaminase-like [Physella acuta]
MPGFVDCHAHAAQYSFVGTGSDQPLMSWLKRYTFPTESRFSRDQGFANQVYSRCVARTLKNGTTTICYYATIDRESTMLLVDAVARTGQRAYIGKVNMDQNGGAGYVEERQASINDTEKFIQDVLALENPLITPCVTPRFAVSCSMELMTSLAHLARQYNLPIQTHVSENLDEVRFVKKLFPHCQSYTQVYQAAGLLGRKTLLAHGIHLTDAELDLIKQTGSGICHCPNSNTSLSSGQLNIRRVTERGIKIGLSTDFAGGHSTSMLDAIRRGTGAANLTGPAHDPGGEANDVTYKDLFRMATLGSSEVMGLDDKLGNFEVGKEFDALVIDPEVHNSPFDIFNTDSLEDIIQKFIFIGDDRNIVSVYVAGVKVI